MDLAALSSSEVDQWLGRLLADPAGGGVPLSPADFEQILQRAELHGVGPLLHARQAELPAALVLPLREMALASAMWELRHQEVLRRTTSALAAVHAQPLFIKGTALAYSLYPDPALRPRADTDILFKETMRGPVHEALTGIGWRLENSAPSHQSNYSFDAPGGTRHTLDAHWRINNSDVLAPLFDHEQLRSASLPVPALGADARIPAAVQSLLIACMHRATHRQNPYHVAGRPHHDPDRLIWLYDIHLLASSLGPDDWAGFLEGARVKALSAISLEGLLRASAIFGTAIEPAILAELGKARAEPPAVYVAAGPLRQQWMDWRAQPTWRARYLWLRDLLLPPEAYMRAKYQTRSTQWLGLLYARRAAQGVVKRLSR